MNVKISPPEMNDDDDSVPPPLINDNDDDTYIKIRKEYLYSLLLYNRHDQRSTRRIKKYWIKETSSGSTITSITSCVLLWM